MNWWWSFQVSVEVLSLILDWKSIIESVQWSPIACIITAKYPIEDKQSRVQETINDVEEVADERV